MGGEGVACIRRNLADGLKVVISNPALRGRNDRAGLSPDMHHAPRRRHEARLADMMASFFLFHYGTNVAGHVFVGTAALHDGVKIVIEKREEAGPDLSVGGDPNT